MNIWWQNNLATPVPSARATGQADPQRLTLTKRAKTTELPLKNNVCYAAPQACPPGGLETFYLPSRQIK
jgi:hypothetical protein